MALKIPTMQTDRIAEVQRQAVLVLRLLDEHAEQLFLAEGDDAGTARCREIADGASVEYRDEYTVGRLLTAITHRLYIGF